MARLKKKQKGKSGYKVKMSVGKCPVSGKSQFANQADADRALAWIASHDPHATVKRMHSYLCPNCSKWHVGHKPHYME